MSRSIACLGRQTADKGESVLLLAAFLIGFFSRLAKALLEEIARFIFGELFEKTYATERSSVGGGIVDDSIKRMGKAGLVDVGF